MGGVIKVLAYGYSQYVNGWWVLDEFWKQIYLILLFTLWVETPVGSL